MIFLASNGTASIRSRRRCRDLPNEPLILSNRKPKGVQVRKEGAAAEAIDRVHIRHYLRHVGAVHADIIQRCQDIVAESSISTGNSILGVVGEAWYAREDTQLSGLIHSVIEGSQRKALERRGVGEIIMSTVEKCVNVDNISEPIREVQN